MAGGLGQVHPVFLKICIRTKRSAEFPRWAVAAALNVAHGGRACSRVGFRGVAHAGGDREQNELL